MQLSEKIQSHLLFAHVRAASPGSVVAERLCHPFRCAFLFVGCLGDLFWLYI